MRPLLQAVSATAVIEVGADQGDHTVLLQDHLREHGGHLHVIETSVSTALADRIDHSVTTVLQGSSLQQLARTPVADVVLIDGDHNHHTVSGELRLIAATAAAQDRPAPLVLLHDVCWPYGRRDMYYDPDRIPDDRRRPYGRGGMHPGSPDLHDPPAIGLGFANAVHEGAPRNGVLTAVEDFVVSEDGWRLTVLPAIHGLGILATQQRIDQTPALSAILDALTRHPIVCDAVALVEQQRLVTLQQVMEEAWAKALAEREVAALQDQLAEQRTAAAAAEAAHGKLQDRLRQADAHAAALSAQVEEIRRSRTYRVAVGARTALDRLHALRSAQRDRGQR